MSYTSDTSAVVEFAFELRSLVTELNSALNTLFTPLGLTCVQAEALVALDDLDRATLTELGTHLVAESGHPSRLVSRLVEAGLVSRSMSPRDARAVELTLTAEGRKLAGAVRAAREPLLMRFTDQFGAELERTTHAIQGFRDALATRPAS